MKIDDGKGRGLQAEVTRNQELAVTQDDIFLQHVKAGLSWNINTGDINLTGAGTTSALLFLQNDWDVDFVARTIVLIAGTSTGGTGDILMNVTKNPDSISTVTAADIVRNLNYRSPDTPTNLTATKGAEAATFTGGDDLLLARFVPPFINTLADISVIVGPGQTLGVYAVSQVSNTSTNVQVAVVGYFDRRSQQAVA